MVTYGDLMSVLMIHRCIPELCMLLMAVQLSFGATDSH